MYCTHEAFVDFVFSNNKIGDHVFIPDFSDEEEMSLGSPALLVEEAPRDPEVVLPDQNGSLLLYV